MEAANDHADLRHAREAGYSIDELWRCSAAMQRATSNVPGEHPILWGILYFAEYQIDHGAGRQYLGQRLRTRD